MRFMMMIKADAKSEAGAPPDPRLMQAMDVLTREMIAKGKFVMGGGLSPSRTGTRMHVKGGQLTVVDGPFAEVKEMIAGFAIMDLASREEALEMSTRFMNIHREILGPSWEGSCEFRPLFDPQHDAPCQPA